MIVRDGAETLDLALESLTGYVDEIVVGVDSRTVDLTRDIASDYTSNIYDFEWTDDFASAKNQAISKASNDFVLIMDADDSLVSGRVNEFRDVIETGDMIRFCIHTSNVTSLMYIRAFDRRLGKFIGRIHEYPYFTLPGVTVTSPVDIIHQRGTCIEPGRNLRILDAIISEYPRYLFYHGRECYDLHRYQDAIDSFSKYIPMSKWHAEKCDAYMGIAKSLAALKQYIPSLEVCFKVITMDPNFIPAYNYIGQIFSVQGKYAEAIPWYESALRTKDTEYVFNEVQALKFNCYGNLILAYSRNGDYKEAKKAIVSALEIDPNCKWIEDQIKLAEMPLR